MGNHTLEGTVYSIAIKFNISKLRHTNYDDTLHRKDILRICENTFDGVDHLPRTLSAFFDDPRCTPVVLTYGDKPVAFCNRTVLSTDYDTFQVRLVQALRVDKTMKGAGLGTCLLICIMYDALAEVGMCKTVRCLANTEPHSFAMHKMFNRTRWRRLDTIVVWPSTDVSERIRKTNLRLVEALGITRYIPFEAKEQVSKWRQVFDGKEIEETMLELCKYGASRFMINYHFVNTVVDAKQYLHGEIAEKEGSSVWKLERSDKLPALIFVRPKVLESTCPVPNETVFGYIMDTEAVESCVAFAASRQELRKFQITFDLRMTEDMVRESNLLSRVQHETFIVYENVQKGSARMPEVSEMFCEVKIRHRM